MLGMQQIAYVKPVVVNGTTAFAIHAADGTPMAIADGRDIALAAIVQHEIGPGAGSLSTGPTRELIARSWLHDVPGFTLASFAAHRLP